MVNKSKDLIFKTHLDFESVTYDQGSSTWGFYFTDKAYVASCSFWRLLVSNKIALVSEDNGHQFGHPEPLDLVELTKQKLTGQKLTEIRVDKDTADLTLTISNNIKVQIFIASSGYETYEFYFENRCYIGLGGGSIWYYGREKGE